MKATSTLYIDESGKSSLAQKENEPFILVGVTFDDQEINAVEGFFNYIKRKHHLDENKPFHSYDIYENPKLKLIDSELLLLSKTLAEYISLIPIEINLISINKKEFSKALGVKSKQDFKGSKRRKAMKDFPYRVMASYLFALFGKHLENRNQIGSILADSRKGGDHQLLKTLHLCKEKTVPFNKGFVDPLINRVTAISFAEKGFLSGGLEITDLISYTSFFRIRRLIATVEKIGINYVWDQIRLKIKHRKILARDVRKFFGIQKGEVHKYLKS